jgi:hypothetical protein
MTAGMFEWRRPPPPGYSRESSEGVRRLGRHASADLTAKARHRRADRDDPAVGLRLRRDPGGAAVARLRGRRLGPARAGRGRVRPHRARLWRAPATPQRAAGARSHGRERLRRLPAAAQRGRADRARGHRGAPAHTRARDRGRPRRPGARGAARPPRLGGPGRCARRRGAGRAFPPRRGTARGSAVWRSSRALPPSTHSGS